MSKKLVNGQLVDLTPAEEAAFSADTAITLPQAKKIARASIAARRVAAEQGGFMYSGARYDSSAAALARVAIIWQRANAAKLGLELGFSVRVSALDDTETVLNSTEYIAFGTAAGDHFVACAASARALRVAVNQAADVAAVQAVNLDAGWP